MKDLLESLVKKIVSKPKEVKVEEVNENGLINLNLKVANDDIGLVIGKSGKVIKSLRNLVKVKAILENKRVNINLVEDSPESA